MVLANRTRRSALPDGPQHAFTLPSGCRVRSGCARSADDDRAIKVLEHVIDVDRG